MHFSARNFVWHRLCVRETPGNPRALLGLPATAGLCSSKTPRFAAYCVRQFARFTATTDHAGHSRQCSSPDRTISYEFLTIEYFKLIYSPQFGQFNCDRWSAIDRRYWNRRRSKLELLNPKPFLGRNALKHFSISFPIWNPVFGLTIFNRQCQIRPKRLAREIQSDLVVSLDVRTVLMAACHSARWHYPVANADRDQIHS